jgi:N-acetylneuraminic acid mutarotase
MISPKLTANFHRLWLGGLSFLLVSLLLGAVTHNFSAAHSPTTEQELVALSPALKATLAVQADLTTVRRTVAGQPVMGLQPRAEARSAAAAQVPPAGLRPEEQAAWLAMAQHNAKAAPTAVVPFFPAYYRDPFVVEGSGIKVVLRPLGAENVAAQIERGKVVYRGAYHHTDSLHAVSGGRSEEFLLLRTAAAPRRFEYEIIESAGVAQITLNAGSVRFTNRQGQGLVIEAPWALDASGNRRQDVVRWVLSNEQANGQRRLRLELTPAGLAYPLVIDPTWESTGKLHTGRYSHTATLLQDGKVLVAGGHNDKDCCHDLTSAELYDPVTFTWSDTGVLRAPRSHHTATRLPNGKVLVVGGEITTSSNSAELYDPATGTWSLTTGKLNHGRFSHTATLLANGQVLVVGGNSVDDPFYSSVALDSAELYDPATGRWTLTGSLKLAKRESHSATLLYDGRVLVAGGISNNVTFNTAELYNPATGTWSFIGSGSLKNARESHTATLLANGQVLVAGGADGTPLDSAEFYDPATGIWSLTTGKLNHGRRDHTATLLANGTVLLAGGYADIYTPDSAELYDSTASAWSTTSNLNTARHSHTATLLANGLILVAGGYGFNGFDEGSLTSAELYNPDTGQWTPTGSLNEGRYDHTATLLADGKVLVVGGQGGDQFRDFNVSSAELYDPSTRAWSFTGSLYQARFRHTATLLPNGKVLVAGGADFNYLNSAELYDPSTGRWADTVPLSVARFNHTATLLANGSVLVAGGYNGTYLSSAELYANGTWRDTGSFGAGSFGDGLARHTATLLPSGNVLVAGGEGYGGITYRELLYDPNGNGPVGSWSELYGLLAPRARHTATLLANGTVLLAGGVDSGGPLNTAELYGTVRRTAKLNTARYGHTATLLPNGKILVAGGFSKSTILNSTELYDVGLGFAEAWRPVLTSATSPLRLGSSLVASGYYFTGLSEASGGNTQNSATNYPLLQLRSLANEQTRFLLADAASRWSDTSFTSQPLSSFPIGYALATVFTNGIPSLPKMILVQPAPPLRIDSVSPLAGRASGGQRITLTGAFAALSSVTIGGNLASWNYTSGTSVITFTSPAHAVGAVDIVLTSMSANPLTKANAFAYLPTTFTDDPLVAGVTTAKAQHILEIRQAVDALRALKGLAPAPWTDVLLVSGSTAIKAAHITELRFYLEDIAAQLGYSAGTYSDPALSSGYVIKRLHIEELRQRIRNIAG